MYATNFEYADEKLSDYGMMICRFDTAGGIETVSSGSDITFQQIPLHKGKQFFITSASYDSALTTTLQICKNPQLTDRQTLSPIEISALQRWLCRKNQYHKFKILQEGFETIYWNAAFSARQILLKGDIIGMELTLYTDAPFAYMDDVIIEITEDDLLQNSDTLEYTFDIFNLSDEEGYIYPDMEITILESADMTENKKFTLTNVSDSNRPLTIKNCSKDEVITINGKTHTISAFPYHDLAKDFNYCFPRIFNSYTNNKNTFTTNLKCRIRLSYPPVRKVGF